MPSSRRRVTTSSTCGRFTYMQRDIQTPKDHSGRQGRPAGELVVAGEDVLGLRAVDEEVVQIGVFHPEGAVSGDGQPSS